MPDPVVIDASALVDLLLGGDLGDAVARRITDCTLHAPAHIDAEVLSALGRMHRAGSLAEDQVAMMLAQLAVAPILRHPLETLVVGAWGRRHQLRLADALYVELAVALGIVLASTDSRLAPVSVVNVIRQ